MKKTNFIIVIILIFCTIKASAQTQSFADFKKEKDNEFSNYKKKTEQELKEYRDKINAEFANFMEKKWDESKSQEPQESPTLPEPPTPFVAPTEPEDSTQVQTTPTTLNVKPISTTVPKPTPQPERKPIIETDTEEKEENIVTQQPVVAENNFQFDYYGVTCDIPVDNSLTFSLASIDETNVADAWRMLSDDVHMPMIQKCIELHKKLKLNDWGYIQLISKFSDNYFDSSAKNESKIVQMFLLTQSGYSVRIARSDNKLVLLMPFDATIYSRIYVTLNQQKYYILDKDVNRGSIYVFDQAFPNEQIVSLTLPTTPEISEKSTSNRTLASKRYPDMKVNTTTNKNLIDFYNDYPHSNRWDVYTNAPLSTQAYTTLHTELGKYINGKSELEAVEMLLNFVQTAFDYKTDGDQFGYERPLFSEESLYYLYNDCEDRSILFSLLVSELLSLDVVLLDFPGHIATAVAFNTDVIGDNLMINDKKYTMCDPTYIGAKVGMTIPEYSNQQAEIITIR